MDQKKTLFKAGEFVRSVAGALGVVITPEMYAKARSLLREGRKLGHFFSPGCCAHPDYLTQVPVLFEDNSFDVMRSSAVKKIVDAPATQVVYLQELAARLEQDDTSA